MAISRSTSGLLATLLCIACSSAGLAAPGEAAPKVKPTSQPSRVTIHGACQEISAAGCCDGERLLFCRDKRLFEIDCRDQPRCGYRKTRRGGYYDCNTAGSSDPTGRHSIHCAPRYRKSTKFSSQARSRCQLPRAGCCRGQTLYYCEQNAVARIDCRRNAACGWRPGPKRYDCGTAGQADPRGQAKMQCPPEFAPDRSIKPAVGKHAGP
ncbi:MAG: hypothetical protein H6707_16110 [Deltaproteobacteria bacterium]|nr:hypothetical protein [Deltaproteobacteria bacterium]